MKLARVKTIQQISQRRRKARSRTIEFDINQGGKPFLEDCKQYARLDRGDPSTESDIPSYPHWRNEICELLGEFRVPDTYLTGIAQWGKTLFHFWLTLWVASRLGYSPAYIFDQHQNQLTAFSEKFTPIAYKWLALMGGDDQKGTRNTRLFQVGYGNIHLRSASTRSGSAAAAGSGLTGFSADIAFPEERSQWSPGVIGTVFDRLSASRIPSQPMRHLGTPGNGNGIEADIRRAHYNFMPHCQCPHCGGEVTLNPKGCLLKPARTTSNGEISYLTAAGRPILEQNNIGWFHHDSDRPVATAYFGCPHCGGELDQETRCENSYFRCVYTGHSIREVLDAIADGTLDWRESRLKAGITITPALRKTATNLAATIIEDGLNTSNPINWQQQQLGLPSESLDTNLSETAIARCIGLSAPLTDPYDTCVLAGIDQGRNQHWLWVVKCHLPSDWRSRYHEIHLLHDEIIREVLWAGAVSGDEIQHFWQRFNINAGLIDCDPEREDAASLAVKIPSLELAKRQDTTRHDWKKDFVNHGGVSHACYFIRSPSFLKRVQLGFSLLASDSKPLYRLPKQWDRWLSSPMAEQSPLRHLTSISFDNNKEKWLRASDHIDDLYFAAHFCEAAIAMFLRKVLFGIRDE